MLTVRSVESAHQTFGLSAIQFKLLHKWCIFTDSKPDCTALITRLSPQRQLQYSARKKILEDITVSVSQFFDVLNYIFPVSSKAIVKFLQIFRPTSQGGRPLSGFVRPGTRSGRPGTMEQALRTPRTAHTARPATSASGRFVRLGTVILAVDMFVDESWVDCYHSRLFVFCSYVVENNYYHHNLHTDCSESSMLIFLGKTSCSESLACSLCCFHVKTI